MDKKTVIDNLPDHCRAAADECIEGTDMELVLRVAADEIERLRSMLTGWSGHAWKSGVYIDDIQEFFDGGSEE